MSPIQIFINRVLTKLFLSTFVQLIYIIFNELFQSSVLLCKFSLKTKKKIQVVIKEKCLNETNLEGHVTKSLTNHMQPTTDNQSTTHQQVAH